MSILLEALRKSEKNQNQQEVPTIHSGDPSGTVTDPLNTGPLIMMLAVSLIASGWFVWRQYQAPDGFTPPPVSVSSSRPSAVVEPADKPSARSNAAEQAAKAAPAANNVAAGNRTPVETYSGPATSSSTSQPAAAGTQSTSDQSGSGTGNANSQSAQPSPTNKKPSAETAQRDPLEPAPISYWELPDTVRESVPEIKFSVLVYASNPDDRFVLINGQRLAEGDSLPSGPVVKEIQREGVIFSYRLYRFLVER
jgi:general secretion pathway protein B